MYLHISHICRESCHLGAYQSNLQVERRKRRMKEISWLH